MTAEKIIRELRSLGSQKNVDGMERFGIKSNNVLGIGTPVLKQMARQIRKRAEDRHSLADELWTSGVYEARAIAFLIDDPAKVTSEQMEQWAADFDNWATVDGAACYLFCRTPLAYAKAFQWAERDEEFVKRAAFALMAFLAVHDKKVDDEKLAAFLPVIEKHAYDDRNFVKKAVNWALRQIGKRSLYLNLEAIKSAERIKLQETKAARWIASDALRELTNPKVAARISAKSSK